jgi:hypothetical protein
MPLSHHRILQCSTSTREECEIFSCCSGTGVDSITAQADNLHRACEDVYCSTPMLVELFLQFKELDAGFVDATVGAVLSAYALPIKFKYE